MPEFKRIAEREYEVYEELQAMAAPHVERSGGFFELLPIAPEDYPAQKMSNARIEGDPKDVGTVELIAGAVEPRFGQLTTKLDELEDQYGEVSRVGEILRSGQNILLVTNHGDIKDIAFVLAAYYTSLKRRGYEFDSSLVMSKILSFFGVRLGSSVTPAVDLLKNICSEEYFSFPQTESMRGSKIEGTVRSSYNKVLRHNMHRQLDKGGNLFAMAASGTTDKPSPDDARHFALASLTQGTAKIMQAKHSLVLPVAVWLHDEQPTFEPCDIPRVMTSEDDTHRVMGRLATTLTESVSGSTFSYKTPEDY